jgi:hypothetical protein
MEQKININRKIAFVLLIILWGAFTFYAGIVVPIGMRVLGSHTEMGFITQEVTNYLNYFSLPIFLFVSYVFRAEKWLFRLGILLILLQISLFILHTKLFNLLAGGVPHFQSLMVKSKTIFYSLHRTYLLISTLIWLIVSGIVFVEVRRE